MRFPSFAHALFSVLGIGCLVGCGGMGSFPSVDPGTSPIGSIHGVNMGGHAPLTGAHIYLLEAGTTGYGSLVKSLITSGSSGATANGSWKNTGYSTDLFVPSVDSAGNPFYGLTTDSGGGFNLTGDYTCDVGRPVYLVGVGGNPGTSGTAVTVISAQVLSLSGSGSSETASVTFTFSSSPGYSSGANLSFSGFSGSLQSGTGINGTTSVVTSGSGATATVSIPDPNGTIAVGTYTVSGTATPTYFNHAAVNVAVLGTCPASGSFAGTIPIIIMNEISTVAAAYVFQPYVATSGTNQTGIDEFHIGSSGTALGLQGIQNAAANAANLYDITGVLNGSHGALSVLPSNSSGIVPQAEINTLGNVLASCVDSGNNYRGGLGTLQASCQTLFQYASSNGVEDSSTYNGPTYSNSTMAFNTFQAAVNIARFPQGAGAGLTNNSGTQTVGAAFSTTTASSYTSALYALETGTVPFTPNLHSTTSNAPDDFAVAIAFSGVAGNSSGNIAIDGSGNIWLNGSNGNGNLVELSSSGAVLTNVATPLPGPAAWMAIDAAGGVWLSYFGQNGPVVKLSTSGAVQFTVGYGYVSYPAGFALDSFGNAWVSNGGAGIQKISNNGTTITTFNNSNFNASREVGIDGSGNVWVDSFSGDTVTEISSSGANLRNEPSNGGQNNSSFENLTIDGFGNVWIPYGGGSVMKLSNSGVRDFFINQGTYTLAIAIDGSGNAWWVTDTGLVEYSNGGANLLATTIAYSNNSQIAFPGVIAVDGSGNVWLGRPSTSSLVEVVGVAPPVITPISAGLPSTPTANGTSNLGTRP